MDPFLAARQKLASFKLSTSAVSVLTSESTDELEHHSTTWPLGRSEGPDDIRPRLSDSDLREHLENINDFIELPYESKDSHSGSSKARSKRRDSQAHFTIRADSSSPIGARRSRERTRTCSSSSSTIPYKITKPRSVQKAKATHGKQCKIKKVIDLTNVDESQERAKDKISTSFTSSPERIEALTIEPFSFPITPPSTNRNRARSKTLEEIKQILVPDNPYV